MNTPTQELKGIERTLLMPLACRAMESVREDAIIHDPKAVEVYQSLGGSDEFLLGMSGHDLYAAAMRVRQFDGYAQAFRASHPDALVVDIGCGLDTRFYRLDDGKLRWLGVDLPEVIELRRRLLPDGERCQTLAQSIFELSWLDVAAQLDRPTIFLAEGIFPYFSSKDLKPLLQVLVERFPGGELVFDGISPFMGWLNNHSSSVLKQTGTLVRWDVKDPIELEDWGLHLLERWGYFEKPEPRLGAVRIVRFIPPLRHGTYIVRYRLGQA